MILAAIFLAVSAISLTFQSLTLFRLSRNGTHSIAERLIHIAYLRTASFRVAASTLYVGLAVATLMQLRTVTAWGLGIYSLVQLFWWANSALDVRLRSRIAVLEGQP